MKYFTMAGWIADQDFDSDPSATREAVAGYRSYLDSIKSELPPDFRRMLDTVCIHDGLLLNLQLDVSRRRLALTLDAGNENMTAGQRVRLWYLDLQSFEIPQDSTDALNASGAGLGDIGNDEVEVLPSGFEHRLLFASGIEVHIRFKSFRLELLEADADSSPSEAAT
jgi:hypothetical protein